MASASKMNPLLMNAVVFIVGVSIGSTISSTAGLMNCVDKSVPDPTNCPPQKEPMGNIAKSGEFETPKFDQMNDKLYKIANKPVVLNRKPYSLGAVQDTGGGLANSDRELLASLYYNSSSVFEFGLGESTHIAAYVGVPRFAGVDSDAVWVAKARGGAKMDHF